MISDRARFDSLRVDCDMVAMAERSRLRTVDPARRVRLPLVTPVICPRTLLVRRTGCLPVEARSIRVEGAKQIDLL